MNDGAQLYRIGESKRYEVQADWCLSADCFDPVVYAEVDNPKKLVACCRTRARNGCPSSPVTSTKTAANRSGQGWGIAP